MSRGASFCDLIHGKLWRFGLVCLFVWSCLFFWSAMHLRTQAEDTIHADIVVVGGGLAGLSAAVEAVSMHPNAKVLLIEKEPSVGGNSAKASSGINAALSDADEPVFVEDTLKSGGGLSNEHLVNLFVEETRPGISFLESAHVDLSVYSQLGGHSAKRTRRNASGPNVGFAIISRLKSIVTDHPHVVVMTSTTAKRVLASESGSPVVEGLEIEAGGEEKKLMKVRSSAVILTTGGFSASAEMLKRYAPGMEKFPTTNGPWTLGEGIHIAESLGADLIHMDKVQLHPTGFINPKDRNAHQRILCAEAIRGSGAILLNTDGKRFVDELTTRDLVSNAMLEQPNRRAFQLLFDGASAMESSLKFYRKMGLVKQVESVAEAAAYYSIDAEALLKELNEYAAISNKEKPDPFGKTVFPFPLKKINSVNDAVPINVMEVEPAVHYCMGGVVFNDKTQVLRADKSPIHGLYAAGEVTGGLHGQNRLGGNSLAECVVFGRLAAREALKTIKKE